MMAVSSRRIDASDPPVNVMDACGDHVRRVEEAVAFLRQRLPDPPRILIVLGTGLGSLVDHLEEELRLPYEAIPHFPRATVTSHAGNLVCGRLGGKRVAMLQGRFHYYEGYSTRELTLPVRVLSLLGAELLLVSNAAGGLNPAYSPGTLMIINDHLNFIPDNPLRGPNVDGWGPRFPDCSRIYDPSLIDCAIGCAAAFDVPHVVTGLYVAIPGPSLETPAETRFLRMCGADAVGMSTVPEVLVAVHAGLRVLGISMVANVNDPDNFQPIRLEDILLQAQKGERDFVRLVEAILQAL